MAVNQPSDRRTAAVGARVAVDAARLQLKAHAGGSVVTRVRVTNEGKTAVALRDSAQVALRRADALARGVREAIQGQRGDIISRLIALGKQLQEEPAPQAQVRYRAAFTSLAPGESAEVEIELRIPAELSGEPGWVAYLPVLGTTVAADLEIVGGPPAAGRTGKKAAKKRRTR
jgi:hypothetical protein